MDTPTLTGESATLNALESGDAELMVETHDEAAQWAFGSGPMTVAGTRRLIERARWQWVRESRWRRFAIRRATDLTFVGWILVHPSGQGAHLVEIAIHPSFRNQGFGTAATTLLSAYAFRELGAQLLEVETRQGHLQSQAMAIRVGFQGVEMIRMSASGYPVTVGRLTREEWESRQ